ncbi:ABC transporter permease [Dyella sp.]|uniref:ABC transporter permease n=1 Tax=Dyella sp. TaxID=1869338 RepID=UPI002B48CA43|nr:FtsX-like permease family protein [Dyella sp.]HKT30639.1 FtsX-like permease family protein [Dyella sp.]
MIMQITPILIALKRHKAGTILIALQIALTLAIVCNALFIIRQRVEHAMRPTGIDESSIIRIKNEWAKQQTPEQLRALADTDLAVLRQIPGVIDAYATNSFPLSGNGMPMGLTYTADQPNPTTTASAYFADAHTLNTLGLKLIAGRNFSPDEIGQLGPQEMLAPPVVIVTEDLAKAMYPDGSALGKTVYMSPRPSTIVGIVERLQGPWVDNSSAQWAERSALVPFKLDAAPYYLIRVRHDQVHAVASIALQKLYDVNAMRVIDGKDGVRTFEEVRKDAYQKDHGMAVAMTLICASLLAITAAGIVGLTSFWVGQRRKHIGVRRALGATRRDILAYFLTENGLITLAGVVLGSILAVSINSWMMGAFEMRRLPPGYVLLGMVALLLLGQLAAFIPAFRATRVSPVEATRP